MTRAEHKAEIDAAESRLAVAERALHLAQRGGASAEDVAGLDRKVRLFKLALQAAIASDLQALARRNASVVKHALEQRVRRRADPDEFAEAWD